MCFIVVLMVIAVTNIIIYSKYFRSFNWLIAKGEIVLSAYELPKFRVEINIRHYELFLRMLKQDMASR